jgi:hypothetical protein
MRAVKEAATTCRIGAAIAALVEHTLVKRACMYVCADDMRECELVVVYSTSLAQLVTDKRLP